MATTKEKIHSFQYAWIKALPLFRAYLLDLGESLRKDLKKELESKSPNEEAVKEMADALKSVVNLLGPLTDTMRIFFGEESLKELPPVRYASNNSRQPYVRRGNWGGPRPGSGKRKKKTEVVAPKVSEERAAIEAFDSLLSAAKPAVSEQRPEAVKPARPSKPSKRASLISPIKKKKTPVRRPKKAAAVSSPAAPPAAPAPAPVKVPTVSDTLKEIEARFDAILDQATWTIRSTKEG
jgi:hypothetical protein